MNSSIAIHCLLLSTSYPCEYQLGPGDRLEKRLQVESSVCIHLAETVFLRYIVSVICATKQRIRATSYHQLWSRLLSKLQRHMVCLHMILLRVSWYSRHFILPPAYVFSDFRLDGILHREWRTRLLTKMDYNINELLQDLMQASTVHPGDVSYKERLNRLFFSCKSTGFRAKFFNPLSCRTSSSPRIGNYLNRSCESTSKRRSQTIFLL